MGKAGSKKSDTKHVMRVGIFVVDLRGDKKHQEPHVIMVLKTSKPWNGGNKHERISFWQQINGLAEKGKDYKAPPRSEKAKVAAASRAAKRELKEEMGLAASEFALHSAGNIPLPHGLKEVGDRYVFVALLRDRNIEQGDISLSLEHSAGAKTAVPVDGITGFLNDFNVPDPLRLKHYRDMWALAHAKLLRILG